MFMWSDVNLIGNEIQVFKLTVDETTVVIWIAFFCIESTWLEFDCSFEFDCGMEGDEGIWLRPRDESFGSTINFFNNKFIAERTFVCCESAQCGKVVRGRPIISFQRLELNGPERKIEKNNQLLPKKEKEPCALSTCPAAIYRPLLHLSNCYTLLKHNQNLQWIGRRWDSDI